MQCPNCGEYVDLDSTWTQKGSLSRVNWSPYPNSVECYTGKNCPGCGDYLDLASTWAGSVQYQDTCGGSVEGYNGRGKNCPSCGDYTPLSSTWQGSVQYQDTCGDTVEGYQGQGWKRE